MKLTIKLQDLLKQNETAIAATSTLLGQGLAIINGTGVESITSEQLTLLFAGIPANWDFPELTEIFDASTLTETVANQLSQWIDQRLGREVELNPTPEPTTETSPTHLDIFELRQDVVGDYRRSLVTS
ncbi:DEAD/DEAH box helicase domain-containing protein [Crinalium epipsammum PCC 9333]|uniref:DEAD/DEAH box helicase domain-containing protein n=1 Tax=Crinalium epipsammum PCC 9333 TaxID=1173022 RepID=K9VU21_9CYAN|nr:hypothetical protein [Crinalium epipsammum]AFZ11461.1 DEAD/DEAH box helicase domain-containing protein [Crinalium epipsammum PCC 9333]